MLYLLNNHMETTLETLFKTMQNDVALSHHLSDSYLPLLQAELALAEQRAFREGAIYWFGLSAEGWNGEHGAEMNAVLKQIDNKIDNP